jgi:hypothetical protein
VGWRKEKEMKQNDLEMAEETVDRVEKILEMCGSEDWTVRESLYAMSLAYVIMSKAAGETDEQLMEFIKQVTTSVQLTTGGEH